MSHSKRTELSTAKARLAAVRNFYDAYTDAACLLGNPDSIHGFYETFEKQHFGVSIYPLHTQALAKPDHLRSVNQFTALFRQT